MPLVFAAIVPHGGIAIADEVAAVTRAGMEELGRRFDAAEPDAVVVATPHNVHIANALGVVIAGRSKGRLNGAPIELDLASDVDLAWTLLDAVSNAGVSAAAVSFGANDPPTAVAPMDWGVLIPLWFMGGRRNPPVPAVIVTPARDRSLAEHVEAGAALRRTADALGRRLAVIASADHGHAHRSDGPYGFDPAAEIYDTRVREIIAGGDLSGLLELDAAFVAAAKADSWWQMLMLHGVLGGPRPAEVLSYQAPTYFGMLCGLFDV